ncbi:MAG: diacylglycerol kinase family protein [Candidatus Omnitrophica bacterium]|nr:diacylglycerol kinase family protein [Candidatus Omnitrophota bacterium]
MPTEKNKEERQKFIRNLLSLGGFPGSLRVALRGIFYLFFFHRNMRIIFIAGIAAFCAGLYLKLKGIELTILCVTITIVFLTEIFNTAIELMIDMHTDQYDRRIQIVKDIAAGVVVLACLNSIAVGIILFLRHVPIQ